MNIPKQIILLLFTSLLLAQEALYQLEVLDPMSQTENVEELNGALENQPLIENNLTFPTEPVNSISTSFDNALKIAKEEHKIILVELVATDCPFCDKMETEVLSKERVQEAIKKDFVLAKVNIDYDEIPLGLTQQMTPMFVFATADENVEDIRLGFIEEENFLRLLEEERQKIK
jgi:thioredoxin-related protein